LCAAPTIAPRTKNGEKWSLSMWICFLDLGVKKVPCQTEEVFSERTVFECINEWWAFSDPSNIQGCRFARKKPDCRRYTHILRSLFTSWTRVIWSI
jgi:hypothetical protein